MCDTHGIFEDIKNVNDRDTSKCPQCGVICLNRIAVNDFMAKTRYILPPVAKKVFGEKRKQAHRRARWH